MPQKCFVSTTFTSSKHTRGGSLFNNEEQKKSLARDVFDTFAKYGDFICDATSTDGRTQNGKRQICLILSLSLSL